MIRGRAAFCSDSGTEWERKNQKKIDCNISSTFIREYLEVAYEVESRAQ